LVRLIVLCQRVQAGRVIMIYNPVLRVGQTSLPSPSVRKIVLIYLHVHKIYEIVVNGMYLYIHIMGT